MADLVLKDRTGRLLGKITERSDGRLEGRDYTGRRKGIYDPKRDQTFDYTGRLVGRGNLLSVLITDPTR